MEKHHDGNGRKIARMVFEGQCVDSISKEFDLGVRTKEEIIEMLRMVYDIRITKTIEDGPIMEMTDFKTGKVVKEMNRCITTTFDLEDLFGPLPEGTGTPAR